MKLTVVSTLAWAVLVIALVYFALNLFSNNNLELSRAAGATTQLLSGAFSG
ncbi:MAG: hypothetical protein U1E60_21000 [Reyranellaceae bacterium]